MNRLLVDRSIFSWTHRVLGLGAGSICVFSAVATQFITVEPRKYGSHGTIASMGAALIFFGAACPFVVSHSCSLKLVDDKLLPTVLFAVGLVSTSILVDIWTVVTFSRRYFPITLVVIYLVQAVVYIGFGRLALGRNAARNSGDF
jgi:hypothetical protein